MTATVVMRPLVERMVQSDSKVSGPALKRHLTAIEGLSPTLGSVQRTKQKVVKRSKQEEAETYMCIPSFCFMLQKESLGSLATFEVSGWLSGWLVFTY